MDKVMFKQRTEEGNELTEQKQKCVLLDEKGVGQNKESIFKKEKLEDDKV